jgi:uncharacterized cupredoxin-like copper-binding protein
MVIQKGVVSMRKSIMGVVCGFVLMLTACGASAAPSNVMEITIETSDFKFQPNTIEVKMGQKVKLTLHNVGSLEHDFNVTEIPVTDVKSSQSAGGHDMGSMSKEPQLHVSALNGKTSILEFTPTKVGTYEVACTVAGHKEQGMVATLIVKTP